MLGFLLGMDIDPKLRAAFGSGPCIVADGEAKGAELAEVLDFAHRHAGLERVSRLALIGYSAGCQRVRALRVAGVEASAYLLADGTHASWPPEEWQIAWLRELAEEARAGRILVVATHTLQTYTEQLEPRKAFACTLRVLREATGMALDRAETVDAPVVSRDGELWVYSYASGVIDAPAHAAQHRRVVPEMCERHLGPWASGTKQAASSVGLGVLGLVAVAAAWHPA